MDCLPALLRDSCLCAPRLGLFVPRVRARDGLLPGRTLGSILVLNRRFDVVVPDGVRGEVASAIGRGPVEYGQVLACVGARTEDDESDVTSSGSGTFSLQGECEVTTPIDGIFYRRASPDSPPYVEEGDLVVAGQTLGLVEVMKTFNPIRYGSPASPERGRIARIVPADLAEVAAGSTLFVISAVEG